MATAPPTRAKPVIPSKFRTDWILLSLIILACVALSLLQWRWTGEFARAERVRLQAVLADQTQRMAQAFDENLRANCLELLPGAAELRQEGAERAHLKRYNEWRDQAAGSELFRRVAAAIPDKEGLRLFRIYGGTWRTGTWPVEWLPLKEAMTRRWKEGGRPPQVDRSSDLIEVPVFAQSGDGELQEMEWMIFEINRDHLQKQLLPGLVARFLNSTGEETFEAEVIDANDASIFGPKHLAADARADLFPLNVGGGSGRGRRRGGDGRESKRWTLLTWHRAAGSLDEAVAQARRRNVTISLALIAVLGGAAWALVRYTAKTRRLADLQMQFVAGVSHDLRTPLAAIRGAAFNITSGLVKPESLDRYGRLILRNAEDLTGLIENLLAFAASKKQMPAITGRVELKELIRRASASIEHELEAFGGELEVNVAPGTPPVMGDAVALERVMRNLLDNAARHAATGKWISVTARQDGGMVELRVRDRGPGIAAKDMPQIFEPFYFGEASGRNQKRGIGLGLSLVKATVETHGGSVQAGNMSSGGAEFIVRLPAAPREIAS